MIKTYLEITLEGKDIDINEYEQKCQKILEEDEIRFVGLLDKFGTVLTGGYKSGIIQKLSDEEHQSVCEEVASRVEKRKKHDDQLGRVKYSASRREDVVIMSFPIYDKVIMVVAESHINIDRFAFRIIGKLGSQWGEFVGK